MVGDARCHPAHTPPSRTSTLVGQLEVLSKHVAGSCSAVAADGDAEAVAALKRELRKPKVGQEGQPCL